MNGELLLLLLAINQSHRIKMRDVIVLSILISMVIDVATPPTSYTVQH
jgi:hypothetical protein